MTIADSRRDAIERWIGPATGQTGLVLTPASEDASFRRYFRATLPDGRSFIVMDAPPGREDTGPFVRIAGLLHEAGLTVPRIIAADTAQGFLLLTDLGRETYLQAIRSARLSDADIDRLYSDALDALVKWQLASRPDVLPPYDEGLLRRELALFPEWYAGRHLNLRLDSAQQATLAGIENVLVRSALSQAKVYVHRDYMPRNLMICAQGPGILDFQDAVWGPVTYDLASLMRDAFLSWEEERVIDWSARYWDKARRAGLPVDPDFAEFYRAFEWMGLQRHLKVLGIFARIRYRDGKPHYLEDAPRFLGYCRAVAKRYRAVSPLLALLDSLEARDTGA
jgi:aminoglycoside/choline kinase family phosphotransferase